MMSADDNKAVVQRMFDAINANDLDGVAELLRRCHGPHRDPGISPDKEGFRGFVGLYLQAFPEQHVDVHELIAEGDRVLARHTHHVTHGGDFAGLPPTGKQAVVDGLELFRVSDGRVAEMWHHDDLLSLMQQLGAIPAPV